MQGQGDYQDDTQGKKRRSESNVRPYISNRQAYLEKNAKEHEYKMKEKENKIKELEQQLSLVKSKAIPNPPLPTVREKVQLWPPTDNVPPMPDSI